MLTPYSAQVFFVWAKNKDFGTRIEHCSFMEELLLYTTSKVAEVQQEWPEWERKYNPNRVSAMAKTMSMATLALKKAPSRGDLRTASTPEMPKLGTSIYWIPKSLSFFNYVEFISPQCSLLYTCRTKNSSLFSGQPLSYLCEWKRSALILEL